MVKKAELIEAIGDGWYETEYAGCMETYCYFCGAHQESEKDHYSDCIVKRLEAEQLEEGEG